MQWIATPNYLLRFGTYGFILIVVLVLVESLRQLDLPAGGFDLAVLVQYVLTQYELARYLD